MKHKIDETSQLVIGFAYTLTLVFLMASIMYGTVPVIQMLVLSAIAYVFIYLVFSSKLSAGIFIVISVVSSLFVTYVCWIDSTVSKPVLDSMEGIMTVWYYIVNGLNFDESSLSAFISLFMVFSSIVASMAVVLIYNKHFSFFALTGLCLAMFLIAYSLTTKENRLLFGLFCILSVVSYIRQVYKKKVKMGLADEKIPIGQFMLLTVPLALIPVLIIGFLPKNDEPIKWTWLDSKIQSIIDTFDEGFYYTDMDRFSLSTIGFSGQPQKLGGPVRTNNNPVMDVRAEKRAYLRGASYFEYRNNSWTSKQLEKIEKTGQWDVKSEQVKAQEKDPMESIFENEFNREVWETRNGWSNIPVNKMFSEIDDEDKVLLNNLSDGSLYEIFYSTYFMEIKFRNMTTYTVFLPLKSITPINYSDNTILVFSEESTGNAASIKKLPRNTSYKLTYLQPMYGEPMFKKALTFSRKGLYKDALDILENEKEELLAQSKGMKLDSSDGNGKKNDLDKKIKDLSYLVQRATSIESDYIRLDGVPQRVGDLAQTLTQNSKSDYEKVIAIEKYLRENYTYTLNAPPIPAGRDFVDFFLFEDNRGYCTYYATAMTVLLRSLGIPSRYVEGYIIPDNADEDQVYTVRNKNAHAWVEVYFEGFGWMSFEPTSNFAGIMDYRNETLSTSSAQIPYSASMEDLMKQYYPEYDETGFIPQETTKRSSLSVMQLVLLALAAFIMLSMLVHLAALLLQKVRMGCAKGSKRVILIYETMLRWLNLTGFTIKPGETVREFGKRIDNANNFTESSFMAITEIFARVRYGKHEVSPEDVKMLQRFATELRKMVLSELGMKKYLPFRFIFMGI